MWRKGDNALGLEARRTRPPGQTSVKGSRPSKKFLLLWIYVPLLLLCSTVASSQAQGPAVSGSSQLSVPVQEMLVRLQDLWLQWDSAFRQGDRERAETAVKDMLATVQELGMSRLPDFCLGILVRATHNTQAEGEAPSAASTDWALAMAERLDPGRPEISFARAQSALSQGSYVKAGVGFVLGYLRLAGEEAMRILWLQNLSLWLLSTLLFTGATYVVLQMMNKGSDLYHDLTEFLDRFLPGPLVQLAAIVVLVWPLVLPKGWMWIVLYWLILLWGYGATGERGVFVLVCILLAATPLLIQQQQRLARVALAPEMRVVENLGKGRLYGGLFHDLRLLRTTLPESVAVDQLVADVHTNLGEVDRARPLYIRVLQSEPENQAALLSLGTLYYHRKDYIKAIERFREASEAQPSAVSYYNLAMSYRLLFAHDEADRYQDLARQVDSGQVREWVNNSVPIVTQQGGLARRSEIRAQLLAGFEDESASAATPVTVVSAAAPPLATLILALALHGFRRARGYSRFHRDQRHRRGRGWREVFVPGLASVQAGEGMRAFLALLVPIAAIYLPLANRLSYRMPWGYDPGMVLTWSLACLTLALYLTLRVGSHLRHGG